jgi:chemotaxis protein methyltransferase CheR
MDVQSIENLEIELLLTALKRRYGYDFSQYAKASLKRRLLNAADKMHVNNISDLIPKLLHNQDLLIEFVSTISVTVTEMFRDPDFYIAFREKIIPRLSTYPFIKIWHAGCATGEEVYSMAIVLHEAGLLERTQLYGTDFNDMALKTASDGIYPVDHIKAYTKNYSAFSKAASFSDYYHSKYGSVKMADFLRERIIFSRHNLASDHHFGEMNIVICRNVLIYFDISLQNKALSLFKESLIPYGYLCLGNKENLLHSDFNDSFEVISKEQRIYKLLSREGEGDAN